MGVPVIEAPSEAEAHCAALCKAEKCLLEELRLTMDQFIDLCILCGCDYSENIRGIGALKFISQHGSIESIVENINRTRANRDTEPTEIHVVKKWTHIHVKDRNSAAYS